MKINTGFSSLSFLKTLKTKGAIKYEEKSIPVFVYQLDKEEDLAQIASLEKEKDWKDSYYLPDMIRYRKEYLEDGLGIYTLEDKNENILSFCLTDESPFNLKINLLETAPKLSRYNKDRVTRFIGETMITSMALVAKSKNKNLFIQGVANRPKTRDFYFSLCKFSPFGKENAILKKRTIPKLVQSNEKHTGQKVELIG